VLWEYHLVGWISDSAIRHDYGNLYTIVGWRKLIQLTALREWFNLSSGKHQKMGNYTE